MSDEVSLEEQLDALDGELQSLQEQVALSLHRQHMADLDKSIGELPQQVEEIRTRGYRYKRYLEGKVEAIKRKWGPAKAAMRREIEAAEKELQPLYDELAKKISALQRTSSSARLKGEIASLESKLKHLKARVGTADDAVRATYSAVEQTQRQAQSQVRDVLWLLDQLDQASFDLLAEENAIQGVRAKWWRDGKNKGPEGNLYLTDQRLVFEQKEKVATKKVLFVATEKETLQEMLFEAPIGAVEEAKASSKGLLGQQDHVDFTFGAGVEYANAHFHLQGEDSEFWTALVNRVQNGDISRERFYAEGEQPGDAGQALEETLANAPERCSSCGAPFDTPLTKGQRQAQCEYCGTIMRW
jgi:predicted  nucleic acid-binding Zn-ribbon protein